MTKEWPIGPYSKSKIAQTIACSCESKIEM